MGAPQDGEAVAEITLVGGGVVLVDAADLDALNEWRWFGRDGYAWTRPALKNGRREVAMHRYIAGARRNPVAVQLCRSGECFCGTQQTKAERAEASVLYPEFGAYLDDLDRRAKAKFGFGWGESMPRPVDPDQFDMFQPLCGGCGGRDAA